MVLQTVIDMSVLRGVDEDLRNDWKEKKEKLATYPVQMQMGKSIPV